MTLSIFVLHSIWASLKSAWPSFKTKVFKVLWVSTTKYTFHNNAKTILIKFHRLFMLSCHVLWLDFFFQWLCCWHSLGYPNFQCCFFPLLNFQKTKHCLLLNTLTSHRCMINPYWLSHLKISQYHQKLTTVQI